MSVNGGAGNELSTQYHMELLEEKREEIQRIVWKR